MSFIFFINSFILFSLIIRIVKCNWISDDDIYIYIYIIGDINESW